MGEAVNLQLVWTCALGSVAKLLLTKWKSQSVSCQEGPEPSDYPGFLDVEERWSCDELDAETAERWGYLNRIFDPDKIESFVDRLASRIAGFPIEAVRLAKEAVNGYEQHLPEGLANESYLFQRVLRTESGPRSMRRFLEIGGQTRDGELRVGSLNGEV